MTPPSLLARAMAKATLDYQIQRKLIPENSALYSSIQPKPSFDILAKACLEALKIPIDKP